MRCAHHSLCTFQGRTSCIIHPTACPTGWTTARTAIKLDKWLTSGSDAAPLQLPGLHRTASPGSPSILDNEWVQRSRCLSEDYTSLASGSSSHADPWFVCTRRGKADSQFLKLPKTLMMSTTERQCFEHEYYAKRNPVSFLL